MAYDNKWSVHDNIWNFFVTDPQLHNKGFTVYKVTCQTFPIKSPEALTEFICWKRYNDFKMLHKSLLALHKALHRKDQFPEFAKPKLFGRFDNNVIEERRISALGLLNFVASQPHLYKSLVFKQFLDDGRGKPDPLKKASVMTPLPSNLHIIRSVHKSDSYPPPDLVSAALTKEDKAAVGAVIVHSADTGSQQVEVEVKSSPDNCVRATLLEGTWNFPQVADNISLDSSTGDETMDTDEDSVLAGSLPDTDLAYFDPVSQQESPLVSPRDGVEPLNQSNSWLLASLNMCVQLKHLDQDTADGGVLSDRSDTMMSTDSTITNHSMTSSSTLDKTSNEADPEGSRKSSVTKPDLDQFDPLCAESLCLDISKVECGKGDLDLSTEWQPRPPGAVSIGSQKQLNGVTKQLEESGKSSRSHSLSSEKSADSDSNKSTPSHTSRSLLKMLVAGSPKKPRSMTDQSVTTMDLGGKEDYIYLAASQISMAQNSEANGEYEVAFAYYKSGVGILLQGVQADTNRARRDAVRRKTAQYLMKAEDLFNKHLASENVDERRWGADSFLSPSLDLDPSFAFIRGSSRELRNFQVLGTIDKVILVRDKSTDETFIFKSIPKTNTEGPRTQSILPTTCPHMVSLHKFYETDDSIFLLLQYASGGKLWTCISDYLNCDKGQVDLEMNAARQDSSNVYSGTKVEPNTADVMGISAQKDMPPDHDGQLEELPSLDDPPDTVRFSTLNRKSSELNKSEQILDTSLDKEEEIDSFQCEGDLDISSMPLADNSKRQLQRRFSSLSDDSAQVVESDSSVISPTTLTEDDHFQSFLQEYRSNVEGFSINSFDSEDTQRLSLSFREKIDSIPEDASASPKKLTSPPRQISADEVFHSTRQESREVIDTNKTRHLSFDSPRIQFPTLSDLDSSELIRNSKELILKVDRALSMSNDSKTAVPSTPSADGKSDGTLSAILVIQQQDSSLSESTDEPSIYDVNRSSEDDTSEHNSNTIQEPATEKQTMEDVNLLAENTTHLDARTDKASSDAGVNLIAAMTGNNKTSLHSITAHTSFSRQTSTPHKLILSRMNSKDMTRSASFECDLKSPTRNRARTLTDLFEKLDSTNQESVHIPEASIKKWMAQLVTAVSRLHSIGIICRDLKPSNILLGEGGQVYLTYFCHVGQGEGDLDWEAVHNLYVAPEVRSIIGYDKSCDWWSIGALLYELLVGKTLVDCHPGGINSHSCLYLPTFVSAEAKGLLEGLLKHNPHERLGSGIAGSEEIKAHPFFAGIDWHALEYS